MASDATNNHLRVHRLPNMARLKRRAPSWFKNTHMPLEMGQEIYMSRGSP